MLKNTMKYKTLLKSTFSEALRLSMVVRSEHDLLSCKGRRKSKISIELMVCGRPFSQNRIFHQSEPFISTSSATIFTKLYILILTCVWQVITETIVDILLASSFLGQFSLRTLAEYTFIMPAYSII